MNRESSVSSPTMIERTSGASGASGRSGTGGVARPLHVHLSEQPGENLACEGFYGCSPTELLAAEGLLTPSTTAVHATHLTDADVARLEALGATRVDVGQGPSRTFVVLADIEGNEFCVLSEE